ncbi:MAG: pyridoxamine 5'-phosphate oxidase family protein [Acidimicrobiaceae bacterium]|nr:pyridoxamine 5'-phosphate oxidase family protein [Acidimicrobiaceae bacterium]
MGKVFEEINADLSAWIVAQPIFFVATAPIAAQGSINCSPKGNRDEVRIVNGHTVAYLDQTGSGVETIAHLRENGRIVLMFCAFTGPPRIVRLHGRGRSILRDAPEFEDIAQHFSGTDAIGVRSVIVVDVERVSDSCGYGVPLMQFESHRPTMDQWSNRKGPDGIREYRAMKNRVSIDGLDGID